MRIYRKKVEAPVQIVILVREKLKIDLSCLKLIVDDEVNMSLSEKWDLYLFNLLVNGMYYQMMLLFFISLFLCLLSFDAHIVSEFDVILHW